MCTGLLADAPTTYDGRDGGSCERERTGNKAVARPSTRFGGRIAGGPSARFAGRIVGARPSTSALSMPGIAGDPLTRFAERIVRGPSLDNETSAPPRGASGSCLQKLFQPSHPLLTKAR